MKDILLLYDSSDAVKWMEYIYDVLCKNDLHFNVVYKDLQTEVDDILSISGDFLVVTVLVSPCMLETMSSDVCSDRLPNVLQQHTCVSLILLYTEINELKEELQPTYKTLPDWKYFDITDKPDQENRNTISEIIGLLEKEQAHRQARLASAAVAERMKTKHSLKKIKLPAEDKSKQTDSDDRAKETESNEKLKETDRAGKQKQTASDNKPKQVKRGNLETVSPNTIYKVGENVMIVLKHAVDGVVQVEFKNTTTKTDTKRLNPYCYSFRAPALQFGRHQFYIVVDGKKQSISTLQYIAPVQMAYECPTFLCQALDISPGDMDGLDRRLTTIFRASLPNDEALSRILSPAVLAGEIAASKVDHHFPTLLHFAAFHGLRDLCNALLDMPGAVAAFHKRNIDDKDPLDLAQEANHEDLVSFFADYLVQIEALTRVEMQETITTYEQFYVHMYDKKGIGEGLPDYLEMTGTGPDHVEEVKYDEDEYEIKKSTLVSGVTEVDSDEDVKEEPKPGLPPRRPTPKAARKSPSSLEKPQSESKEATPPPVAPRRQPYHAPPPEPVESPEEFFGMVGTAGPAAPPRGTGSGTLDELIDIQEAFKRNEINTTDVEMLYSSWTERTKEGKGSTSMKERHKQLSELKEKFGPLIKAAEKTEKRSFFDRITMKKKDKHPQIEIEHLPSSNPYTAWSEVPSGFTHYMSERDARISTISNSSTSSSSSYASSTSRDSAMSLRCIPESDSDEEMDDAPEVPIRRKTSDKSKTENRQTLSEQFLLQSVQNKPQSRLPKPPPQHYRPKTNQPKVPVHRTATTPYTPPAVPPRKTSH